MTAEIEREDGARVEVELLRPVAWIEEQGFTSGARIYLRLEELNIAGWATIRGIDSCPTLSNGHGNLVTGRFVTRGATNLVEATFSDGLNEPTVLNGTSIHPVWSLDRLDWVPLGELAIGEQVSSNDGPLQLTARTFRNHPADVYNIEVDCEHVYQVGDAGILVHNTCATDFARMRSARQLANDRPSNRVFRLDANELQFVDDVLARKPNLQIYRTNQKGKLGDFLVIDRSNPRRPVAFLMDLKSGGGSAGNQLQNWKDIARVFDDIRELDVYRYSGSIDELLKILSRGREAWPQ